MENFAKEIPVTSFLKQVLKIKLKININRNKTKIEVAKITNFFFPDNFDMHIQILWQNNIAQTHVFSKITISTKYFLINKY